jgi:hypothetical protein
MKWRDLQTSSRGWLVLTAVAPAVPYAAGTAYVAAVTSTPSRTDWLNWAGLSAHVTALLSLAALTSLVCLCLGLFATRRRSTVRAISLWINALTLSMTLVIAIRLQIVLFALNLIVAEGGVSGLSNNPKGTYLVGTISPPIAASAELRVLYLDNANGVRGIAMTGRNGCFATEAPQSGGQFGVFVDHHYWPLEERVSRGYFRVAVALRAGEKPNATMATWERISALTYVERALQCGPESF